MQSSSTSMVSSSNDFSEFYQAVVESSSDAIITKTLDGIITSWNRSAEKIFGYTAQEAIGKSITMLIPEDHKNDEPKIIARIKNGELVDHYRTIRRRKDGSLLNISLTVSPVKNKDGVIIGASKIARDISAQVLYEQKLVEQANDLEQFAFVASHDLKEPLRKISTYTQILEEKLGGSLDEEGRKFFTNILNGVSRMSRLISDLLSYSRTKQAGLDHQNVDMSKTVDNVLGDLEVLIKEKSAVITHDPLPMVMASASQMHQLFLNLIGNSIKFHGPQPPKIHISTQVLGGELVVAVQDNGIGIDPKYFDRIFKVFQRLHSQNKFPGTGIGLAVCKKIVDQYGGRIWVESKLGEGSTFSFSLPLERVVQQTSSKEAAHV